MPDRTLAPFGRRLCPVVAHAEHGAYDVISVLDAEGPAPDPGQFYMLAASERWGGGADERPFLPRAFSVLRRHEDMRITGKRHPYSTDYRLGLDGNGRFLAFEATYYQNAGAAADLSPAILERTLFHATNSYYIPPTNRDSFTHAYFYTDSSDLCGPYFISSIYR